MKQETCTNCGKTGTYPDIIRELLTCNFCGNCVTVTSWMHDYESLLKKQAELYGEESLKLLEEMEDEQVKTIL